VKRAAGHVGPQPALVESRLEVAAVIVVPGVAPDQREPVGREDKEGFRREPSRHVLDVRVEAAVLVDDEGGRERTRAARLHEVAAHGAGGAAGRGIADVARPDRLVGERNGLRLGVAGQQGLGHRQPAGGDRRGPLQEAAAVHPAVAVLVVKVENALVYLSLRQDWVRRCRHLLGLWHRVVLSCRIMTLGLLAARVMALAVLHAVLAAKVAGGPGLPAVPAASDPN